MHDWVSIAASLSGTVIAFLATMLVGLMGYMGKFAISSLEKQIDAAKTKIAHLEVFSSEHSNALASVKTQTEAEAERYEGLKNELHEVRSKLERLGDTISELNGHIRLQRPRKRMTK